MKIRMLLGGLVMATTVQAHQAHQAHEVQLGIDMTQDKLVQLQPWLRSDQSLDLRYRLSSRLDNGQQHSSSAQSGRVQVVAGQVRTLSRLSLSLPPVQGAYRIHLQVWQGDKEVAELEQTLVQQDGRAVIGPSE